MKTVLALASAAVFLAAGSAQAAELLVNGGFENDVNFAGHSSPAGDDDVYLLTAGSTLMPGWTVVNGSVGWSHDGNPWLALLGLGVVGVAQQRRQAR